MHAKAHTMIIITGAAGFIGSNTVSRLNKEGYKDLILVDQFTNTAKMKNIAGKTYTELVDRQQFFSWLKGNENHVEFIIHMGARSATTGYPKEVYDELNLNYSKKIWELCVKYSIPLIYASSAATYGLGEHGYEDREDHLETLHPLNLYGKSKNDFDIWVLKQKQKPFFWAGLKFFNVYGPNEYHKGRMASVVYHAFNQIKANGSMKLFRSHHPDFKDGEQSRDFIYVKDVVDIIYFLMESRKHSGIYNAGTGQARTFYDLTRSTFKAMNIPENILFIDTPEDIRDKYQYFTEAQMEKIRSIGYDKPFTSLEKGVDDYVKNYLIPGKYN